MMKKLHGSSLLAMVVCGAVLNLSLASVAFAAGPVSVNLGSAGNFAVLAKSGISATGSTLITGDIGVSPAAATFITGFGLSASTDTTYSTSPLIVGKAYAANYTAPTPTTLTTAISDMQTAYTDAAGRSNPTATELGAGTIGGLTIAPGLYKWGTAVTIPTDVTLSGGANDVWIFQIAQTLTVSSGVKIILSGGAQASNVYWVVAGQTTLGTTADFNGNILDQTAIVLNTGAKLNGRALAQTAVTLDANAVTRPASGSVAVVVPVIPIPTPTPTPVVTPVIVSNSNSSSVNVNTTSSNSGVSTTNQTTIKANPSDQGCLNGNKFSTVSGSVCPPVVTNVSTNVTSNTNVNFGQQVRSIARNLRKGSNNSDVSILQAFLISQGKGPAAKALENASATGYFGLITRSALAEFQAQAGISPASGNFGPLTRAYIASNY